MGLELALLKNMEFCIVDSRTPMGTQHLFHFQHSILLLTCRLYKY